MPNSNCSNLGSISSVVGIQGAESPVQESVCWLRVRQTLARGIEVGLQEIERTVGRRVIGEAHLIRLRVY
jgi:hypothetical protein